MQNFLGSDVLDVGIGMTLLFLFISLICAAVREGLEAVQKKRAFQLHKVMCEILSNTAEAGEPDLVRQIYIHPSVNALFEGLYPTGRTGRWWQNLPSYIPPTNFATALLDIAVHGDPANAAINPTDPVNPDTIRKYIGNLNSISVQRAVLVAFDFACNDVEVGLKVLEGWYDSAMDRVSGWYRRETQKILFFLGLIAAVALNIDAITVVERLSQNKALRDAVVAVAQPAQQGATIILKTVPGIAGASPASAAATPSAATSTSPSTATQLATAFSDVATANLAAPPLMHNVGLSLRAEIESLGLPIGWDEGFPKPQSHVQAVCVARATPDKLDPAKARHECSKISYAYYVGPQDVALMVLGWLVTAFAITLGAPFWFDILNKFMVVRSTVKPREKSRAESSKDPVSPKPATAPSADGAAAPSPD